MGRYSIGTARKDFENDKRNTIQVNTVVSKDHYLKLDKMRRETGIPISILVRMALIEKFFRDDEISKNITIFPDYKRKMFYEDEKNKKYDVNKGKGIVGIDKQKILTPEQKKELLKQYQDEMHE